MCTAGPARSMRARRCSAAAWSTAPSATRPFLRVTIALVLGVAVGLIGRAIIDRSEGERIATQEPAGSEAAPRPEGP